MRRVHHSVVFQEIDLENPAQEDEFFAWWDRARKTAEERAFATASLYVLDRGRYLAVLEFPLPGAWRLLRSSRSWTELDAARPPARVTVRPGRTWLTDGNPRTLSVTALRRWIEKRAAGQLDFVLLDTLARDSFGEAHIPGASNLPFAELDASSAARAIGTDLDRPVVVYCSSYG